MIESVLAADGGLGGLRVITTCQRLGIKAVALTSADEVNKQARLADDVVLLSPEERSSGAAVVAAAKAAGVDAIHPGIGPLAGDAAFAAEAEAAGLAAVVTLGTLHTAAVTEALAAESITFRPGQASVEVLVFGTDDGVVVLGELGLDGDTQCAPALGLSGADRDAAHRTGHAVGVVLALRGLASIGIADAQVCHVRAGLAAAHSAWEMATGTDLVELQLSVLRDAVPDVVQNAGPPQVNGVALTGERPATDADAPDGVRWEVFPSGAEERIRVTAWGDDEAGARAAFATALGVSSD